MCFKLSTKRLTQDLWPGFGQDKGIDQAFWPIFELEDMEEGKRGSHWLTRVALATGLAASVWALHVYAPDRTRLKGASATNLDPALHSSCVGAACPRARTRTSSTDPSPEPTCHHRAERHAVCIRRHWRGCRQAAVTSGLLSSHPTCQGTSMLISFLALGVVCGGHDAFWRCSKSMCLDTQALTLYGGLAHCTAGRTFVW